MSRRRRVSDAEDVSRIEVRVIVLLWSVTGLYALGLPALGLLLKIAAKVGALGS
jgi:hypothetical protein